MRRIPQIDAKKGIFIESCDSRSQFKEVEARLEKASRRNREMNGKELVYIVLPVYSKVGGRVVQYQIYLIDKANE